MHPNVIRNPSTALLRTHVLVKNTIAVMKNIVTKGKLRGERLYLASASTSLEEVRTETHTE